MSDVKTATEVATRESGGLQRYNLEDTDVNSRLSEMVADPDGQWVRYQDVEKALETLAKILGRYRAALEAIAAASTPVSYGGVRDIAEKALRGGE